jgi:hypothetical protein
MPTHPFSCAFRGITLLTMSVSTVSFDVHLTTNTRHAMTMPVWTQMELRSNKLADQDNELRNALGCWQGYYTLMKPISDFVAEHDISLVQAACKIAGEMLRQDPLPSGCVLWHATPVGDTIATKGWLATSAERSGAEAFAARQPVDHVINKLCVMGSSVRAVAVGTDSAFEHEKEILVQAGCTMRLVVTHSDGIVEWEMFSPQSPPSSHGGSLSSESSA